MFWIFFPHHILSFSFSLFFFFFFARSHTVLQCGLKTNKGINIRLQLLSVAEVNEGGGKGTKLLAVDLGRKSFRGENDFLKGTETNNF
jgi:hypothetical protein